MSERKTPFPHQRAANYEILRRSTFDTTKSDNSTSSLDDPNRQTEAGESNPLNLQIKNKVNYSTSAIFTSPPTNSGIGEIGYQRRPKPPFSYIALIAMAIRASPSGMATLNEINDYLRGKFAFFRGEYTGWRNSVRHNLSLNDCFRKILRDPSRPWGKDNYWTLHETEDFTFCDGIFQRRRRRTTAKVKKEERPRKSTSVSSEKGLRVQPDTKPNQETLVKSSQMRNSFTIDNLLKPALPKELLRENDMLRMKSTFSPRNKPANVFSANPCMPPRCQSREQRKSEIQHELALQNPKNSYEPFQGMSPYPPHFSLGTSLLTHHHHTPPLSLACPYLARLPADTDMTAVGFIYSPYQIVAGIHHLPCIGTACNVDN